MDEDLLAVGSDPFALAKSMGFNLSPWYLVGASIFNVIGLYYFLIGRKRQYRKTKWSGVVLMAYPLFVSNTFLVWCVGAFLWSVAYYYRSDAQ